MEKQLYMDGKPLVYNGKTLKVDVATDVTADGIKTALGYTPSDPADYQARFDGEFLQIAYSYVSGGGATNSKEHYEHCAS